MQFIRLICGSTVNGNVVIGKQLRIVLLTAISLWFIFEDYKTPNSIICPEDFFDGESDDLVQVL